MKLGRMCVEGGETGNISWGWGVGLGMGLDGTREGGGDGAYFGKKPT